MATAETVTFGEPHAPKPASFEAFKEALPEIKRGLIQMRHDRDKHDPETFHSINQISDHDLTTFTPDHDLILVATAETAYGLHLFGKLKLPAVSSSNEGYIHARIFVGEDETSKERVFKFHSILSLETEDGNGDKHWKVLMSKEDSLEWFES